MTSAVVTDVRFTHAHRADQERGLLGWVSFVIDGAIRVDGVAIRRTRAGELTIALPEPTDANGKRHQPIRLLDQSARRAIEAQVFAQIGTEATL